MNKNTTWTRSKLKLPYILRMLLPPPRRLSLTEHRDTTSQWRPRHQWHVQHRASRLFQIRIICQSFIFLFLTLSVYFCPAVWTRIDKIHLYLGRSGRLQTCVWSAVLLQAPLGSDSAGKAASSHYRLSRTSPDTKVNHSQPIWRGPLL